MSSLPRTPRSEISAALCPLGTLAVVLSAGALVGVACSSDDDSADGARAATVAGPTGAPSSTGTIGATEATSSSAPMPMPSQPDVEGTPSPSEPDPSPGGTSDTPTAVAPAEPPSPEGAGGSSSSSGGSTGVFNSAGAGGMDDGGAGGAGGTGASEGASGGSSGSGGSMMMGMGGMMGEVLGAFALSSPSWDVLDNDDCTPDTADLCPVYPEVHTGLEMGMDTSPEMSWTTGPEGTLSYAITLIDLTTEGAHWVMWDIPADVMMLPEGLPDGMLTDPAGAQQAANYGRAGHFGSGRCGNVYEYRVYALGIATLNPADSGVEGVRSELESSGDVLGSSFARLQSREYCTIAAAN